MKSEEQQRLRTVERRYKELVQVLLEPSTLALGLSPPATFTLVMTTARGLKKFEERIKKAVAGA